MMAIHPLPDIATDVEDRLVRAARGGDDQAFGELIEPWRRPLFGYVYRMVTHPQDAEDLTQEAVTRAFQSVAEFRAESRFKSWLFGIATHICGPVDLQNWNVRIEAGQGIFGTEAGIDRSEVQETLEEHMRTCDVSGSSRINTTTFGNGYNVSSGWAIGFRRNGLSREAGRLGILADSLPLGFGSKAHDLAGVQLEPNVALKLYNIDDEGRLRIRTRFDINDDSLHDWQEGDIQSNDVAGVEACHRTSCVFDATDTLVYIPAYRQNDTKGLDILNMSTCLQRLFGQRGAAVCGNSVERSYSCADP